MHVVQLLGRKELAAAKLTMAFRKYVVQKQFGNLQCESWMLNRILRCPIDLGGSLVDKWPVAHLVHGRSWRRFCESQFMANHRVLVEVYSPSAGVEIVIKSIERTIHGLRAKTYV